MFKWWKATLLVEHSPVNREKRDILQVYWQSTKTIIIMMANTAHEVIVDKYDEEDIENKDGNNSMIFYIWTTRMRHIGT